MSVANGKMMKVINQYVELFLNFDFCANISEYKCEGMFSIASKLGYICLGGGREILRCEEKK